MEQEIKPEEECRTIGEYLLYKLDRTLTILAVTSIAIVAMILISQDQAQQVATAAVGGLIGYLGGRASK
jgi:hypothetical protein